MEMEKVMAKLASLEDQLQKEAVRREFAGYKVVPQLESEFLLLFDLKPMLCSVHRFSNSAIV